MKPTALGIVGWVIAAAFGVGCASSVPPPNDQWAAAQADVGRAQAGGAPAVPAAKLHLQLAMEDLQKSHQAAGSDDERATTLAILARSEAQLALALTKQSTAQDQASKAESDLQGATNAQPPNGSAPSTMPAVPPPSGAPALNPQSPPIK